MTDQWMDRLSEYLDGELTPAERMALEAHLPGCPACRTAVAELRRVVAGAHALADRPVTNDLWAGIAERIGAAGTPVVDLASRRRRLTLSLPQLAAAAVLFLAVGAAGALALRPGSAAPTALVSPVAETPLGIPAGLPVRAETSYDAAVADLERALAAGQGKLSPKTRAVLQRNLDRIDAAIAEARTALQADPANAYLNSHLANTLEQKLTLLQQATALATSAS